MARRLGWPDEILQGLAEFERLPLAEAEKVALRYAERMTRESRRVDEGLFSELRQHFDEGQVVELTAVIGIFNYFNRFNNALAMEPTRPGER